MMLQTLFLACAVTGGIACAQTIPELAPVPKVLRTLPGSLDMATARRPLIVVGDTATEPERYAAERLQALIARRYGVTMEIRSETAGGEGPRIVLGQTSTNRLLQRLCERHSLDLWTAPPPMDAYAIEALVDDHAVVVCGSNPRGVIYGAQTLFRLLGLNDGELSVPAISVRDWPSIPWRGRPHSGVSTHLEPGVMDAYLWAGLNFIDVRAGAFGYGPDAKLDADQIGRCLTEAHRRGLFVFGTVSCGVAPEKFDGAMRVFGELADMGIDGLWISFDDPGGGKGTVDLARRVIAFGKERGMTGRAIATTPPSGSYQTIDTEFNRAMAKVPGMETATWFFTRNPCAEDLGAARQLGLDSFPAWWHNWPRTEGGFTHGSYGGPSFRPDRKQSYMEVPPLTWGWHNPNYEKLRDAARNTDTVMMWGGWQPEYTCAVLGIWAWDPEHHDFLKTRRAIYATVYGAANADRMMSLDDLLHELKARFQLPGRHADATANFPARLRPTSKPEEVAALLDKADALEKQVAHTAPSQSLLTPERLQTQFLEPLHAELQAGRALATLQRPEQWWPAHGAAVLARLAAGDTEAVEQLSAQARPRVEQELTAMQEGLAGLIDLSAYADFWTRRAAGGVDFWRAEVKRREQAFAKRMASLVGAGLDPDAMLAPLADPPDIGKLVGTVDVQQLAVSAAAIQGKWLTGLYPSDAPRAFVMSFPGRTASAPGDLCQVTVRFRRPHCEGKLHLQLFLTDEYDSARWTGYRFYQLLHGRDLLWEEDIALTRRGGHEWSDVDISGIGAEGEETELTLRLLDKRAVGNYTTTVFIGPLRLVNVR